MTSPRLLSDCATAVMLLTRIPLPPIVDHAPARAAWAFPLVGALLGAATGAIAATLYAAGLNPGLAAGWSLAASLLLTGALHEDGLADTADGLGGGRTRERRLAIMRDSRIGSFGALALALALGLRWLALALILAAHPRAAIPAMALAGALGRCAMLVPLLLSPARDDGLSASLGEVPRAAILAGWAFGAGLAFAALPPGRAALALALALGCGTIMRRIARIALGGQTGDLLGATEQLAECAVLTLLAG